MDRITRKELKTDRFAVEVGATVEFLEQHKKQATIIGAILAAVIIVVALGYYRTRQEHLERQTALKDALRVYDAAVSKAKNPFFLTFDTEEDKSKAVDEAFGTVVKTYEGTDEATIAKFYLGISAFKQGRVEEAERLLKEAADSGSNVYASQASYSLAQLYFGQGRNDEAEKILRGLMENPTIFVTKEQATLELARVVAKRDPEEARRLLEPLRTERSAVSRAALTILGQLN